MAVLAENAHPFENQPERRRTGEGGHSIEGYAPHSDSGSAVGAIRQTDGSRNWKQIASAGTGHPRGRWTAEIRWPYHLLEVGCLTHSGEGWVAERTLGFVSSGARERLAARCMPIVVVMQAAQHGVRQHLPSYWRLVSSLRLAGDALFNALVGPGAIKVRLTLLHHPL